MAWKHVRLSRFGGPEVLELVNETILPDPGPGEARIKVLAAGTGFTDSFIRRGRYPDFKGPLPFTPGYELVGIVDKIGPGATELREGQTVADLCVVGGYAQYAIRPVGFLVPVPDGVDASEAVCIPLAYLTAFQMLTRYRRLPAEATILVIGASGTVGAALLDLARHFGLKAIGTCSAANMSLVERYGATPIDYRAGDFVATVRRLTAARPLRRRCGRRLRRYRRSAFCSFLRLPGARRIAGRLWLTSDGGRKRRPCIGRTRPIAAKSLGRAERPIQRPPSVLV
jgi:NADPH:quinone reductase-like Zn-dependent oxidoreductase